MSKYTENPTAFKDKNALVECLIARFGKDGVSVLETPAHLYGYQNDIRPELADIIIRRQYVGGASNDIGFKRDASGQYHAIISEFDASQYSTNGGYGKQWQAKLNGDYNEIVTKRKLASMGIRFSHATVDKQGNKQLHYVKA